MTPVTEDLQDAELFCTSVGHERLPAAAVGASMMATRPTRTFPTAPAAPTP